MHVTLGVPDVTRSKSEGGAAYMALRAAGDWGNRTGFPKRFSSPAETAVDMVIPGWWQNPADTKVPGGGARLLFVLSINFCVARRFFDRTTSLRCPWNLQHPHALLPFSLLTWPQLSYMPSPAQPCPAGSPGLRRTEVTSMRPAVESCFRMRSKNPVTVASWLLL